MKKKIFIFSIIFILPLCFILTGCFGTDNKSPETPIKPIETHTHLYSISIVEPTCTTEGYTLHTCSCGQFYKDNTINALGHTYVEREQNYN